MKTVRKYRLLTMAAVVGMLPAVAVFADTGGATNMPGAALQQPEGVAEVAAATSMYTVQDIDSATRMVTLKAADGSIEKVKCGPEVRNFDQIKTGDSVKATVMDEVAVGVNPSGQAGAEQQQMVAVAPKGAKPGLISIVTEQVSGKVLAVDREKRLVSIEGPMGSDRTIKAGARVDLDQLKKGDTVNLQVARGFAIMVQKPSAAEANEQ